MLDFLKQNITYNNSTQEFTIGNTTGKYLVQIKKSIFNYATNDVREPLFYGCVVTAEAAINTEEDIVKATNDLEEAFRKFDVDKYKNIVTPYDALEVHKDWGKFIIETVDTLDVIFSEIDTVCGYNTHDGNEMRSQKRHIGNVNRVIEN